MRARRFPPPPGPPRRRAPRRLRTIRRRDCGTGGCRRLPARRGLPARPRRSRARQHLAACGRRVSGCCARRWGGTPCARARVRPSRRPPRRAARSQTPTSIPAGGPTTSASRRPAEGERTARIRPPSCRRWPSRPRPVRSSPKLTSRVLPRRRNSWRTFSVRPRSEKSLWIDREPLPQLGVGPAAARGRGGAAVLRQTQWRSGRKRGRRLAGQRAIPSEVRREEGPQIRPRSSMTRAATPRTSKPRRSSPRSSAGRLPGATRIPPTGEARRGEGSTSGGCISLENIIGVPCPHRPIASGSGSAARGRSHFSTSWRPHSTARTATTPRARESDSRGISSPRRTSAPSLPGRLPRGSCGTRRRSGGPWTSWRWGREAASSWKISRPTSPEERPTSRPEGSG